MSYTAIGEHLSSRARAWRDDVDLIVMEALMALTRTSSLRDVSARDVATALLVAGASAGVAWLLQTGLGRYRTHRRARQKAERSDAVAQWEGEGGNTAPGHPALTRAVSPARHQTH
ncbi:MAG: hypothetical protein JSR18_10120 [Proteobacteria bacterium]|nr:hypothetical protein [Pseudomonadota bacterium]